MEATVLSIGKSVLSGALGYTKSAVAEEVALQLGISRDQAFIKDELEMMLSFLMAAHEEQDKHEVRETWVRQIRVVAYDVEDSLMDFAVRVRKQPWWRTLLDRRRVAKQMKDLRAKVEDVSQRNLRYRLIDGGSTSNAATAADSATTAMAMFGINEARYAAKKEQTRMNLTRLINKEGDGDLGVVAVWGTSGSVGHTSIIWEAYENSATQNNFPCRAWVRVMHPFSSKEFILSLLEEFRPAAGVGSSLIETEKMGHLVEEFHGYVNGKRCLIVLNDLSTIEEWNRVKRCFPINKAGNRIIVSTMNVEVASLCVGQNSVVSELKQLSADQTIYAFYKEPTARPSVQISTIPDSVQGARDEDGNIRTKESRRFLKTASAVGRGAAPGGGHGRPPRGRARSSRALLGTTDDAEEEGREEVERQRKGSQDVPYSAELVPSIILPTSDDIQGDQSNDDDERMKAEEVVEESQLVGREREKELIANLILGHSDKHLEVIAVWGMGGIGKTTLVADVYQRQKLNDKFTKRAFVTVLRPFRLEELLRSIAIQLDAHSSGKKGVMDFARDKENDYALMSVDRLTKALEGLSQDKKCLIVVDDLLQTKEWDAIAEAFGKIESASWTIVITTRQKDIVEHCCKKPECRCMLDILQAKEAHELFIKTVFKKTIDLSKEYPELVEPAKLILNKCNGLPLAIVTIGSFLAGQEAISAMEWRKLNEHITAELEMNPKMELIRSVLMKSYDGLPYYLKPCFLYMSIFPEDCNISRRCLVRRWAVEGYSAEARDKSCMEIADGYFEELIERSMVLPTRESTISKQKADSCKLHDLIRDISISMSTKENLVFRLEEGCSSSTHGKVRHLAISSNWEGDEAEFQSIVELSCIRSLTVFGKCKPFYISDKMRFLRVLDLEDTADLANHCLADIGKLVHLRYLSLRGCDGIFCLPDSVGNLSQLEVLDIKWTEIQVLPKTIVRLRMLRYIHAGRGSFCFSTSGLSRTEKCTELLKVQRDACFGMFHKVYYDKRSRRDWCAIACCAALPPIMMGMKFPDDHGVTVPKGMDKLKSLHTLRYVHLAWGNAAVEEIKGFTSLRNLGVVGISEKNSQNLCLAISKLSLLESLSLSMGLDYSDFLSDMEPPPENLQSLKLCGRSTELPEWIKGLQNLTKLTLAGTGLSRKGAATLMQDIGKLRNLSILSLREYGGFITVGDVQFKTDLFMSLKVLELIYAPRTQFKSVKFDDEAMPKLEVLRLDIGRPVSFCGVQHLQSIKEIRVSYWDNDASDEHKQSFFREVRKQLDKEKMGHLLKVV
ncbi:unnamed protein product [Urochloa decumbens]|uniref:Disease resistance protein RPM1 n=1 Tax=Urochloa decumbens TaxID=240449 RepID=A0ABC8W8Y1_9POAL